MSPRELWDRFQKHYCDCPSLGLSLDVSRMPFRDSDLDDLRPAMDRAYAAMVSLEEGDVANPDENRMVGHYWLRAPELAPTDAIADEIRANLDAIEKFAADVHSGAIRPTRAERFTQVLSVGIGGSALGPMFVAEALGDPDTDRMTLQFLDNTDPEGIDRVLRTIGGRLPETLVVVTSKSGGTPETRNGMLLAAEAFRRAGLDFSKHAVAVTMAGSKLDKQAEADGWLARFPMWDWIGGRTSELSAVGLLPAFLQGIDMRAVLEGARDCDEITRREDTPNNPAALMALTWYVVTGGKGLKDLVVLPYNDRLLLFSRYLQQLLMESLGKRLDLDGNRVDQGLSVYGNKGSTDQHAYVQQLRDGVNNFFVTFIRVLAGRGDGFEVEPGVTAGDYLHGFQLGTRAALFDNDRASMTLTIAKVEPRTVGILIALFERTVGFYASLINVNAYHQPGVEAGKKAAAEVLTIQSKIVQTLDSTPRTADAIAQAIGAVDSVETVHALLEHLAARGRARLASGERPGDRAYVAAS